jgi:predicted ribosomally synthesized peptide with nif11-like leader
MSEEQFSALLAQLQEDSGLMEKFNGAADLEAAVAIAKDAGFDVSADDWHQYQAGQGSISAEELAAISGGKTRGLVWEFAKDQHGVRLIGIKKF